MSKKITIEIGKNYIKILEGTVNKKILISKVFEIESDDDFIRDDSRVEEDILYKLLGEGIVNNNFSKNNVTIVLSGIANILIREMVIPALSPDKTYSLLKFEAKQSFPVNVENFVVDYKQLSFFKEGKTKKQHILMVAVPKKIIEGIINVSERLHLRVKKIDLESNALWRVVSRERGTLKEETATENTFMIVNLMRYYVTVVICKGEKLLLAKTFPFYQLERIFRSEDMSEEVLFTYYGYMLSEVVENVAKFYEFFKIRRHANETLSNIYLTGELCKKMDMRELMKARINSNAIYLENLNVIDTANSLEELNQCSIVTAIGGLLT
ncbi:Tfp pilus assembly protein ATPase PilM-like protein [Caldicellulosiruptor hydrothermalis 108]|uniref:Tfp pilus assembly protein ATPase PilM-like protein n=1 Tax=Caldicellulosiruptor hydrothermalis (strain DSM 18901 / VKM B-2411 / 108) TaxID=632292 RepID=E4Q7C0_CALH1|nr:pilus assembly protein PilM [Caldicellulosiruptor hydrothermalis]ADQ06633.1 Tfp pilus assembly protein ATPase PilM-like protein [Caldicellulosiruptor hydrothermalis 108]